MSNSRVSSPTASHLIYQHLLALQQVLAQLEVSDTRSKSYTCEERSGPDAQQHAWVAASFLL